MLIAAAHMAEREVDTKHAVEPLRRKQAQAPARPQPLGQQRKQLVQSLQVVLVRLLSRAQVHSARARELLWR